MSINLKGTGVALVTPFRKDGCVDFTSLQKLIEHVISGGVEYLVVMGTTGENPVLSEKEQKAILDYIVEVSEKKVPIVFGIGANNTQTVINTIQKTDFSNIDAILSATPYYNKPSQEGLYEHYKAISNVCPVPIILYNVPGRTSVNLNSETIIQLATDFSNIIAVKEASGNLDQVMQIIKNKPSNFSVISGDDTYTLPYVALGMDGVISVTANVFPKLFSNMVRASLKYDFKNAQKPHYDVLDLTNALFVEGNPSGVKAALEIIGICEKYVRLPLVPVSNFAYDKIKKHIEKLNKIK